MTESDIYMLMWESVIKSPFFWALIIMIFLKAITDSLKKRR